jgi:hypothetical protein
VLIGRARNSAQHANEGAPGIADRVSTIGELINAA